MKKLSKHDLHKLTAKQLREKAPFLVVADGEVIVAVVPVSDVNKLKKAPHDVNRTEHKTEQVTPLIKRLPELPLSKHRQAQGRLSEKR